MAIAGIAVGASYGYIYVRSEYPQAVATLREALDSSRMPGHLGANAGGSGQAFDMEVRVGAGAYICGEETALLGLPGRQARHRSRQAADPGAARPVRPADLVHNVLTLASRCR